jgi:hypothetical protein
LSSAFTVDQSISSPPQPAELPRQPIPEKAGGNLTSVLPKARSRYRVDGGIGSPLPVFHPG